MYKVSNNLTPEYISEMFTKRQANVNVNDSHVLRSMTANNFLLPKPNTELYKGSLAFSGPVIWSCLETSVNQRTIGPENAHLKPDPAVLSHHEMTLTLNTHTPLLNS